MIGAAKMLRGLLLPLVFVLGCRPSIAPEHGDRGPGGFKIVAEYLAGESLLFDWNCTINGDGTVVQETRDYGLRSTKKTTTLSRQDLADILAKLKDIGFYHLRDRYSYRGTDFDTMTVAITENGQTKKVSVYGFDYQKENPDVKRFCRLWAEILRNVPAPNAEQKAEDYEK